MKPSPPAIAAPYAMPSWRSLSKWLDTAPFTAAEWEAIYALPYEERCSVPPSDSPPTPPSSVSPLSEEAIAELERLHAAAQPAPWKPMVLWQDGAYPVGPYSRTEQQSKADAACIAALHNAFPALLAEVRAGRKEIERLRSVIGANYSVQRWTGANIAEVEQERDTYAAKWRAVTKECDAALAQLSTAQEERAAAIECADRYAEHIAKESYALGMGETMTPEQRVSWMRAHAEGLRNERDAALAQRDDAVKRAGEMEAKAAYWETSHNDQERRREEAQSGFEKALFRIDAYRAALEKSAECCCRNPTEKPYKPGIVTMVDCGKCGSCLARAALSAEVK